MVICVLFFLETNSLVLFLLIFSMFLHFSEYFLSFTPRGQNVLAGQIVSNVLIVIFSRFLTFSLFLQLFLISPFLVVVLSYFCLLCCGMVLSRHPKCMKCWMQNAWWTQSLCWVCPPQFLSNWWSHLFVFCSSRWCKQNTKQTCCGWVWSRMQASCHALSMYLNNMV